MGLGGFLKGLGKGALGMIPGGGTALSILDGASAIAGGMAKNRADGKVAENNANLAMDKNRLDARSIVQRALMDKAGVQTDRAKLDLSQRDFAEQARGTRFKDAMHGAAAMNMQDVHANRPNGVPTIAFSGGLRPSAFGAEGKAAGNEMVRQSMLAMMNGDHFDKLEDPTVMDELSMTPQPKAGIMDKILGIAGPVLSGMSVLGHSQGPPRPQAVTNAPTSIGAMPGGAVVPRTAQPRLPSRPVTLR